LAGVVWLYVLRMNWRCFPAVLTAMFFSACVTNDSYRGTALSRYEFTKPEMGLPFRIVLYAPNEAKAKEAAYAAFTRIEQLNDILSDYDADSELSRLSRTSGSGQTVKVSDDLWLVLKRSQELAERSRGAFDVTVGPAVNLWRKARREKKLPDETQLAGALAAVGYKKLRLDPENHTAELLVPNMRLDVGAIAKGYAVDEAQKVLRRNGIDSALVAGGGDLAVSEAPPGKKGWRIEIAPLDIPDAPPKRFVLLKNAGLATSGDVFQHLEIDGKRYSHIVDPRTGIGLLDHSLVTIIAKDCNTADSLATAASVLGPEAGMKLIEETRGAEIHFLRKPAKKIEAFESHGFKRFDEPNVR
jgi:thiamine biosynthesis lipoprotein